MDLSELEPLDFRTALVKAEDKAITTRRRKQSGALRGSSGFLVMIGGMFTVMGGLMALAHYVMPISAFLGGLLLVTAILGAFAAGMSGIMRYIEPGDRKLLPYLFEPQAKAFFLENVDRRERLLERTEAFDDARRAFKALPEKAGSDEVDAGVVENLTERRAALAAETTAYLDDFTRATEDDRRRVADIERARGQPKTADKRALAAFKSKVWKLRNLEEALEGLQDSVEKGMTVDLSPYVAAQRLRGELEREREALVARGLKPKRLPKVRTSPKFLPART